MLAGHYDDTYRRTPEGWRFTSRHLTKYYQGPPDLLGEFFDVSDRAVAGSLATALRPWCGWGRRVSS